MKQSNKLPKPAAQANPLGEWYADIDVWNREPFVVMLNAATGAMLVLNGHAAGLQVLHKGALLQFASPCELHWHSRAEGRCGTARLRQTSANMRCGRTSSTVKHR